MISFLLVIIIGSILLSIPISQAANNDATYFDHLFISVSAVCVTGLFTESIADTYSLFGQIVLMIMIQIGGLGLMSIIGLIYFRVGQRVSLKDQLAMSDALNRESIANTKNFIRNIFKYTAIIEGIGAILFATYFIPHLGIGKGVFTSLFLAISAFCNAGFDPLGNTSLLNFQTSPIINWTAMFLIVTGGIGFSVWFDMTHQVKAFDWSTPRWSLRMAYKNLQIHTKLAFLLTAGLIAGGATLFCLMEWSNPSTLGTLTTGQKIMTGLFQTITMRTAGFATVDYTLAHPVSLVIFIATMFIGGSPGGTAGGLKTTTFALILLMAISEIKQRENINFSFHTIPRHIIRKAYVIFLLYMALLITGLCLITFFDPEVNFLYIVFESVSAIATVGVTANLTPTLSMGSHIVIMILMFIGRIGPMTMFLSLRAKDKEDNEITYAKGNILIG